jgi:hypothetical protein
MEHWECHFCKGLTAEDKAICWNCGRSREETAVAATARAAEKVAADLGAKENPNNGEPKYPALRTISSLLNAVGILALVAGVLVGIVLFASIKGIPGLALGVVAAIFGLVLWLFLKAAAESLVVLVDIERNTRLAAKS